MYRLFFNLILIFAFSSALISQESKPANTTSPASGSATAASPQTSPAQPGTGPAANTGKSASPMAAKAQTKEQEEGEAETAKPAVPAPSVPPTAAVITLDFCKGAASAKTKTAAAKAPEAANCKVVITKAQFDKVLDAAIPRNRRPAGGDVPQQVKQAVAKEYLNMYIMAREAERRGYPAKDPMSQEMLKLSRMQVLSMALNQELQENAKPTDAEVDQYYKNNPSAFIEVSLRRLYIPKPPQTPPAAAANAANPGANAAGANANAPASTNNAAPSTPKPDPEAQKAAAEAQKASAEKLRARAVAGEDLDKLEKEAFGAISSKQTPPQTQMGNRRRGIMPPDQDAEIFSLNQGEVSKLFENPGGWYVYKVDSKRTIPFNEAKEEIQRKLQPEKLKDAREAITTSVKSDLNDKYFGTPTAPVGAAVGKTQTMPAASRPSSTRPQASSGGPKPASTADAKSQPAPKADTSNH